MKIASANLQMAATSSSQQRHTVTESLRMWVGQRPEAQARENKVQGSENRHRDDVHISHEARAAQQTDENDQKDQLSPKLRLLRGLLEALTGQKIQLLDASELNANSVTAAPPQTSERSDTPSEEAPEAGYGVEYDRHEEYAEYQRTEFSASGQITTADGKNISFSMQISMEYSYYAESNTQLRLGDATRKVDPLMLNFGGQAADLQDMRFSFDLDANGQQEQIHLPGQGSGFLVFDRNQDGKINDGRELFGPSTGNGFAELAKLDSDANGWIDENDPAYAQLQIWQPDAEGKGSLRSLKAADVGAIALQSVATPFAIKDANNQTQGEIARSGIFLRDSGTAGTIQHVDLSV